MRFFLFGVALLTVFFVPSATARPVDEFAGKRVVFLGDSITQGGMYVGFTSYYLQKLHPDRDFDFYSLGLSSETVSGLSEEGHAGGRFPRPHLFERLERLLEKVKPEVVFACYGINCGIYQPLDDERFAAFQSGVRRLMAECRAAGVEKIVLVTPPIYDAPVKKGEFNYDEVMSAYAAWETGLEGEDLQVIDLHTAMRKARDQRSEPFSPDKVHPGAEGHLLMARTILQALGMEVPDDEVADLQKDPLFQKIESRRKFRSGQWMKHIGYTRAKRVEPQPLGDTESEAARRQEEIDRLRRP
jgi:lysophospholipase L1-like esterase